jgi:DNA-binding transcriptional LysR family regulator
MLSLRALQALSAVRARGSVAAAAAALGYTPSAISQQLDRLQRDTKTVLLEPYGRSVRLTPAGELLANSADVMLRELEAGETALERMRGAVYGTVRVAAFPTAARGLLPRVLADLRSREPDLEVGLVETHSHQTLEMLDRRDCDIAIAHDWPQTPLAVPQELEAQLLGSDVADVVLPADHRLARRKRVDIRDLSGETWVAELGSVAHDLLVHVVGAADGPRVQYAVSEFATQLALIASGLAIGLVPRMGRAQLPADVVAVPTEPVFERRCYAVVRVASATRPSIQAVLASLRTHWPEPSGR